GAGGQRGHSAAASQQTSAALRGRGGDRKSGVQGKSGCTGDVLHRVADRKCATQGYGDGRITYSSFDKIRTADCDLCGRSLAVVALVYFRDHEGAVGAGQQEIGSTCRARTDRQGDSAAGAGAGGQRGHSAAASQQTSAALRGRG